MAGTLKVDSINADSNLALKIANTAVAFIDATGLRPVAGNLNLDATATSKFYLPSANTVAIQTAGVTAVTVDSSQNVTLAGTLTTTGITNSGVATGARFNPTGSSVTGNGMYLPAANSLGLSTNGTNAVYIDSSQNVGVGTTTPARRFHFKAAGVTTLGNSNGALFTDASNAGVLLGSDNAIGYISGVTVAGTATANLVLQPFGGNAMVGTTTTRGKLYIHYDSNSSADPTVYFGNDGGSGVFASFGSAGGTVIGTIARSSGSTAYNTSSDYRLKNTIAPMTGALAKVGLLNPVTYKWNLDGSESQGFIAHELQTVVPECVTGEKDEIDADGKPIHQGVDTSFLVATLTAAIQELKAIVDAQATRIVALESK